jgi:hypothetical protein
MRRALGPLLLPFLLVVLLAGAAGCGDATDATSGSASDSPSSAGTSSSGASPGAGPAETVAMISQSNAGGRVGPALTALDSRSAIASFAAQFHAGDLGGRLQEVVDQHDPGPGRVLAAAVVSIGCDIPSGVEVERTADGLQVTPRAAKGSTKECFVPVTTVAVVDVDASLV